MANPLPLKDWKHILLDTSVIIDYLKLPEHFDKNPLEKERIILVRQVIGRIYEFAREQNKKCTFYVSAISVAEIRKLDSKGSVRDIVRIFSGSDVVFVDFTKSVADKLNSNLKNYLPGAQLKQFEAHLSQALKSNNVPNVRQWLSDDMKICATAAYTKMIQVVLTSDKNTFFPIAKKFDLQCIPMYREFFDQDLFGEITNPVQTIKP